MQDWIPGWQWFGNQSSEQKKAHKPHTFKPKKYFQYDIQQDSNWIYHRARNAFYRNKIFSSHDIPKTIDIYKIHLMPKTEKLMNQIVNHIKKQGNISLLKHLVSFTQDTIDFYRQEKLPIIVIYTRSKKEAQEVLNNLYQQFGHISQDECFDWWPRYNRKITPLIYYAQGNSDHKKNSEYKRLFEMKKLFPAGYFENKAPNMVHFSHTYYKDGDIVIGTFGQKDIFIHHLKHPNPNHPSHPIKRQWYMDNNDNQ